MKSLLLLFLLCSCSHYVSQDIIPIQRLQVTPAPICKDEYAIDIVECLGLYKKALQKSNNNIEEFLKIYNNKN